MPGEPVPNFTRNLRLPEPVAALVEAIAAEGGKALLVGGCVRDLALGVLSKDLDVEVHGMTLDRLEGVLSRFGRVDLVGKQFGVLRLRGLDTDFAVPRRDSRGCHPEVEPDPWMGIEEAARRRDLTINAMALDPLDGTLLDPFHGLEDLRAGVLRAPDPGRFAEDPLRYYRVMAFAARFEMEVDPALTRLCGGMELGDIARERVEEEFARLFLLGRRPSLGLRWVRATDRLAEILPEAAPLVGLEQDPEWHPEGDAWTHTLQVVDAAARLRTGEREQDLMLLYAALCHDLGKAQTTRVIDGRIRSPGHCELAGRLAPQLLERIVSHEAVKRGAVKLSVHHLKPHDFYMNRAGPKAFKRLALALSPETSLERLAALALADSQGRNPEGGEPLGEGYEKSAWFLEQAQALRVQHEPERPVLMGRHLLDVMKPGPAMGRLLKRAYDIQLNEEIRDVEELKARVLAERGGAGPE